jgi:hypothetical protein
MMMMLSSYLFVLPSRPFPKGFPIKILYRVLLFHVLTAYPVYTVSDTCHSLSSLRITDCSHIRAKEDRIIVLYAFIWPSKSVLECNFSHICNRSGTTLCNCVSNKYFQNLFCSSKNDLLLIKLMYMWLFSFFFHSIFPCVQSQPPCSVVSYDKRLEFISGDTFTKKS